MAAGNKCYTLSQETAAYWAICSHFAVLPPDISRFCSQDANISGYVGLTLSDVCLATGLGRCQLATFSQTCGSTSTKPVHLVYIYIYVLLSLKNQQNKRCLCLRFALKLLAGASLSLTMASPTQRTDWPASLPVS